MRIFHSSIIFDWIDDSHDRWIYRRTRAPGCARRCRPSFANDHHDIADAGIDRIQRQQLVACVRTVRVYRANDEDSATFVPVVLLSGHDVTYDSRENHTGLGFGF
jgi:hypothetical protein